MASKKNIQLLLTENVASLGIVGDVVTVKPGFARNYLLPHGLATAPTAGAMKRVEARRAEVEKQLREERAQKESLIARLEGTEISLLRSANEEGHLYGSVTQADIAAALGEEGLGISDRDVRIGEPIKYLDSYTIPIQLDQDLRTEIKLWVVSDKASEELQSVDEADEGEASADEAAPPTETSAEPEAAGSP